MKTFVSKIKMMALIGAIILSSCTKDENVQENQQPEGEQQSEMIEKYFLGGKVKVKKENDGTYSLYGSDIRLFEDQLSDQLIPVDKNPVPTKTNEKLALGGRVNKWTNNTVFYRINGLSASVRDELQKSFDEWTSKTNVKFVEQTDQANYVTISSNGASCNCGVASLGMNGSSGFIRLGTGSTAVVIIHELGHTLGYLHEQNRPDRDQNVIINYQNIEDGFEDQFDISQSAQLLTDAFDINSTMMYGSFTFSKNGQPTITDLQGNLLPRRRAAISDLDIQGTNQAYPDDGGPGTNDPCENVAPWNGQNTYEVGDRVTYFGNLFEKDFLGWIFITACP